MLRLLRDLIVHELVREITAPPNGMRIADDQRSPNQQLADDIRAQGSSTDHAVDSIRAYMPDPFPPPRPNLKANYISRDKRDS